MKTPPPATAPLAILGGAFDPFHLAHLHLARRAAQDFSAQTLVIPNGCPPHRPPPQASWQHRLAMCKLALADDPTTQATAQVSDMETPRAPRYTAHTLAVLRQRHPRRPLLLITGADSYADLHNWHTPEIVLRHAHLLLVPRADAPPPPLHWGRPQRHPDQLQQDAGGVYLWDCRPPPISATQCRQAIAANQPLQNLLPPPIIRHIQKHALYKN